MPEWSVLKAENRLETSWFVCTRASLINLELLKPILHSIVGDMSTKQDVLSQKEVKRWMNVFEEEPDG